MDAASLPLVHFRDTVTNADKETVRRITSSSRFFTEAEIEVAVELVDERLKRGDNTEYSFLFAEIEGRAIGYSCFGPIPCTVSSFDLFWIAVEEETRGRKLGSVILQKSEEAIKALGGARIYVETSAKALYEPTRHFYEKRGYRKETVLEDFYAPGDGKVIYVKAI